MSPPWIGVKCLGCGCTEARPCLDEGQPCAWVAIDPETFNGLCTRCNKLPFDQLLEEIELRRQAMRMAEPPGGRPGVGRSRASVEQR